MESPQQKQLRVQLEHQLVKDLHAMRDTLTHLSLMLHDLKFEADARHRQDAIAQAGYYMLRAAGRSKHD
jgi:hypothetical protein